MSYSITEFETIYKMCFPASLRLAMGILHNEDEARDVVHEVFLKLWESKTKPINQQAFIIRATRNTCLNRLESIETREKIQRRIALEPPPDNTDFDQCNEEVRIAMITLLSPREKQVIEEIYTQGLSYKETAEKLGVSIATVNKNLVATLKKLRIHFKTSKK